MPAKEVTVKVLKLPDHWTEEDEDGKTKYLAAGAVVDSGKGEFDATIQVYTKESCDLLKEGEEYKAKAWSYKGVSTVSLSPKDNPSLGTPRGGRGGGGPRGPSHPQDRKGMHACNSLTNAVKFYDGHDTTKETVTKTAEYFFAWLEEKTK